MFNGHVVLHYRKTWESAVWMDLCVLNCFTSVQFSRSVVSDSLWPHGLQHARPPCPPPIPGVYSNSCPLSQWCHPIISSSVIPFSSHLQFFPASGSFQMSQFFTWKYWSFSFSISPSNEYSGLISFRMDWLDLLAVQEIPLAFGNFQKKRPPAILAFENIITPYFKEKQSYMLKINLYFFNKNIKLSI